MRLRPTGLDGGQPLASNFDQSNLLKALSPSSKTSYTRIPERFICQGLDLVNPPDSVPDGKYPILKNVRAYSNFLQPRPGTVLIDNLASGSLGPHSIRRLNDQSASTFTRVVGSGTVLYTGQGSFTSRETGFSGDPLTLVPVRPPQSPRPWMYVADRTKMRKVLVDGTDHEIGVAPPSETPVAALDIPDYKDLDDFDYANSAAVQAAWIEGGDAGNPTQLVRVNTTMTAIQYDRGTIGWASVQPAAMTNIERGMRLIIDSGGGDEEDVTVQSVHPAGTSTTIASIIYDIGSTGNCSIALTTAVEELQRDSLVFVASAERVRVLSVSRGPDGTKSFRCFTVSTRAAGNAIVIQASFRAFFTNLHGAGEDVDGLALTDLMTFSTGKGTLTNTISLDLSDIVTGRPALSDDVIHCSLRFSVMSRVTEGRLLFDIDDDNFDQNYFIFPFRPGDLTPAIAGDQEFTTSREDVISKDAADEPTSSESTPAGCVTEEELDQIAVNDGLFEDEDFFDGFTQPDPVICESVTPTSVEISTGDNQWHELVFRIRDLIRVGTDEELTLKDVGAIRLELTITADVTVDMDSWWVGGGRGPSIEPAGAPYTYRFRGRVSSTGAKSNFSPILRSGISPTRQQVNLGLPGLSQTEVDRLDVSRFGGNLLEWHYIGTTVNFASKNITAASNADPVVITSVAHGLSNGDFVHIHGVGGNTGSHGFWEIASVAADTFALVGAVGNSNFTSGGLIDPAFRDNMSDATAASNPSLRNDNFQPWPTVGAPVSGTTTAVAGTSVTDSGSNFSTSWAPGTVIHLDGIPYSIYRVISTSLIELAANAGSKGVIRWDIFEPIQLAQPLPTLWGPFEGYMFACGDPDNPGLLYFTKANQPDSTTEQHKIEVTSPSEPLMNGVMYNGRAYVFSTERMFAIYPAFNEGNIFFRAIEVPNGKGLFSRWFLAVGPKIWIGAKDGIYETVGGEAKSITDNDLYPLFPHEGQAGADVNGIQAPQFSQPNFLRLAYYDSLLYFDYRSEAAASRTLVYDSRRGGWFYDEYKISGSVVGALTHYGEEGEGVHALLMGMDRAAAEDVYQLTGSIEATADLDCQIRTASRDEGDPRSRKRYGEVMIDADGQGEEITVEVGRDSHREIMGSKVISHNIRDQSLVDLNAGKGDLGHNLSVDISWSSQLTPKLYLWERSLLPRPEDVTLRGIDYDDGGHPGSKFVQGVIIEADTKGVGRIIKIQRDNDVDTETITATHDGRIRIPYSFVTPFHAQRMRLLPADAADWRLFGLTWVWEPAPELVKRWITQPTSHDLPGFQHLRSAQIALISTDEVLLTVNYDNKSASFTIDSTNGVLLKQYVPFTVMKAKVFQYKFSSATAFRLYSKDCEVRVKPWGSQDPYMTVKPFGGESRRVGAMI